MGKITPGPLYVILNTSPRLSGFSLLIHCFFIDADICDNSEISEAQTPSRSCQWPNGDAKETQLEYIQLLLSKAAPLQVLAVFLTESPACQSLQTAPSNQALDTFAQQINNYLEVEVPIFT